MTDGNGGIAFAPFRDGETRSLIHRVPHKQREKRKDTGKLFRCPFLRIFKAEDSRAYRKLRFSFARFFAARNRKGFSSCSCRPFHDLFNGRRHRLPGPQRSFSTRFFDFFFSAGKLAEIKIGVKSLPRQQLLVGSLFDDPAVVHDEDHVGVSDGR